MVICLERGADLHMAQLMPLPLTVSCFTKIQIGFTFLLPARLGSPGQRAVKRMYVCMSMYGLPAMQTCLLQVRAMSTRPASYPASVRWHGGSHVFFKPRELVVRSSVNLVGSVRPVVAADVYAEVATVIVRVADSTGRRKRWRDGGQGC